MFEFMAIFKARTVPHSNSVLIFILSIQIFLTATETPHRKKINDLYSDCVHSFLESFLDFDAKPSRGTILAQKYE